jgi:DNA polymerase I-like protein with 3'-5' exonuclease and polymerase domains
LKVPEHITIDFETEGIEARPQYPPRPTAVSILRPGQRRAERLVWGHPEGNNCSKEDAYRRLSDAYKQAARQNGPSLLFQNGKFDTDVADVHFSLALPPWNKIDDTLFLIFLHDPHAKTYSLKPSAERILGMKPEERDAVKDWVVDNIPEAKRKPSEWGKYICKAPGQLVGRYMDGDVIRTDRLFRHLWPEIVQRGMLQAYEREKHLMPYLLQNEREGMRVDLPTLERDYDIYMVALESADAWLRKRLHAPDLNIDSDNDFADALEAEGIVTSFKLTAKGNRSVSKKNLTTDMFTDAKVAAAYGYRNRVSTCLSTFMSNWIAMARACNGRVHSSWNQVRHDKYEGGKDTAGARTGRMSCSWFMNTPKNWKKAKAEGYVYPGFVKMLRSVHDAVKGQPVPDLPLMRRYFMPNQRTGYWGRRDYNQQELRILAHFEDGDMCAHYNAEPRWDYHTQVQGLIHDAGFDWDRDPVKTLNFQDMYGGGATALAEALGITVQEAAAIKRAKRALLPDFTALEQAVRDRGKAGLSIRTWGGREYFCEPPAYSKKFKREMTFEYKLLNYLIQGSAADCTKEAIVRWCDHPKKQADFLVTVHDEINLCAPKGIFKQQMAILGECMRSVEFDVPMLSDGEYGPNWGTLQELKEKL